MKKIFISQPMKGLSDEQIKKERESIIKRIKDIIKEDFEINNIMDKDAFLEKTPLECLAISINKLAKSDMAYFGDGWQDARGCSIEYICAVDYKIPIIDLEEGKIWG